MFAHIYADVLEGNEQAVADGVAQALVDGAPAAQILQEALIAPMHEIGGRFEAGECFVPEMLVAAHAMKAGLRLLRPHLVAAQVEPVGTVVLGTVHGDLHDIGKNLVGMLLEGAGFQVIDLGVNVPPARFVEAVQHHRPALLGMSALLTTTMPAMRQTLQALAAAGLRGQVTVMVGGAPITQAVADEIGADLFAPDAATAASRARAAVTDVRPSVDHSLNG